MLAGRDMDAIEAHDAELRARFPDLETLTVRCDVTDEAATAELAAAALERFGRINILVNTAGVIGPIETPAAQHVPLEDFPLRPRRQHRRHLPPLQGGDPGDDRRRPRPDRQPRGHLGPARLSQPGRLLVLEVGGARPDQDPGARARPPRRHRQHGLSQRDQRRPHGPHRHRQGGAHGTQLRRGVRRRISPHRRRSGGSSTSPTSQRRSASCSGTGRAT